jgi:hypothetical protein
MVVLARVFSARPVWVLLFLIRGALRFVSTHSTFSAIRLDRAASMASSMSLRCMTRVGSAVSTFQPDIIVGGCSVLSSSAFGSCLSVRATTIGRVEFLRRGLRDLADDTVSVLRRNAINLFQWGNDRVSQESAVSSGLARPGGTSLLLAAHAGSQ